MTKTHEETAVAVREEENFELSQAVLSTSARAEVEGAIIIAKKFPRDEDRAYQKLMRSCQRPTFADNASYAFPRGGVTITGPSAPFAREMARIWGNIEYGLLVVRDDEETRQIRGWAWDKETNAKVFAEDSFAKLIYRKKDGWIKPDERDLRELTNRRGAILIRNCILSLIPSDFIDDAQKQCLKTLRTEAAQDPDKMRKNLIMAFNNFNISVEMLERKLGHPIKECTSDEIVELRQIWQSITEGNSKWSDYTKAENGNGDGPEQTAINIKSFEKPELNTGIDIELDFAKKNFTGFYKKAMVALGIVGTQQEASKFELSGLSLEQKKELLAKINVLVDSQGN